MTIGAVAAGIYWTSAAPELGYILDHSRSPLLLLEDETQYAKLSALPQRPATLRHVVTMRGAPIADTLDWPAFLALGQGASHDALEAELQTRLHALQGSDLGTLIYTSGTTGHPKAVMLTHHNLAWTAQALIEAFHSNEFDRGISYLPLAHVAEQVGSIHGPARTGAAMYFAQSIEQLGDHLKEVQPTLFFGVPRVWEKIQAAIEAKLATARGLKAVLARWAMDTAERWHATVLSGQTPSVALNLSMHGARRLVLRKVHAALGLQSARLLITSAAPISIETLRFFTRLDLLLREVYGQSEVCGPTSISLPGHTRLGTVGRPLSGVQVRLTNDDEICVRGPNVFAGYAGQAEASAEVLQDGWLHSGDLGAWDADGYLQIIGRKKDVLITSGGKNISPSNIEMALMNLPLIEHAVVVGDGRHYLTALLTLDTVAIQNWAQTQGLDPSDLPRKPDANPSAASHAWVLHPQLQAAVQAGIDSVNQTQARVAHIRRFAVLPEPLSIAQGELTATLKIKRNTVIQRHRALVEQLYRHTAPDTDPIQTMRGSGDSSIIA